MTVRGVVTRPLALAAVAALTLVLAPAASAASTFTVTTTTDSSTPCASGGGVCSLRGAVLAANATDGATIVLPASATPQVYSLTLGELYVTSSVTLKGAGPGTSVIEQHGQRVFELNPPASGTVTISGVEITGGVAPAPSNGPAQGGGILIDGTAGGVSVSLSHVLVDHNSAAGASGSTAVPSPGLGGYGGGIAATGGALTITDSTISDNTVTGGGGVADATGVADGGDADGGGLYDNSSGVLTVTGSAITGNTAEGGEGSPGISATPDGGAGGYSNGGGIYAASSATVTVTGGTINTNTATAGAGGGSLGGSGAEGGIACGGGLCDGGSGTMTVTGATIDGNTVTSGAGGFGAVDAGQAAAAEGGGVATTPTGAASLAGPATISDSTISDDDAVGAVGGGSISQPGGYGGPAIGGGIFSDGSMSLTGDTLSTDTATGGDAGGGTGSTIGGEASGGGAFLGGSGGMIDASTVASNTATGGAPAGSGSGSGGGISTAGSPSQVTVLNSTIVGNLAQGPLAQPTDGDGGGAYVEASTTFASDTLDGNQAPGAEGGNVYVSSGVMASFEDTIVAAGVGAAGSENCFGPVRDIAPAHNLEDDAGAQCGFAAAGDDLVGVNPSLASALASNGGPTQTLELAPNSKARGAGGACLDPSTTPNPPLTVDQRGEPRGPVCDIGAFQTEAPQNTALPNISGTPSVGSKLTCGDGTWIGDGSLTFTAQWLRDGATIPGASAATFAVAAAEVGHKLTCAVTASSAYGSASATSAAVTISEPLAPTLTGVSQTAKTWREANRTAQISRKRRQPPVGTKFSFKLNEAATVSLAFTQPVQGRKLKRKCVAQTRHNRHAPACTLKTLTRATVTVAGRAGENTVKFYGRTTSGHKLKLGTYTVAIVAVAEGHSSTARRLTFTIVK